ncbi:MAG: Glu-tRNA(Gln) amidotransferase GatDE subunit E, partial [Candidatus Bathyarchaeia archaeon]
LSKHEGATAKEALESLGLAMISQKELEGMINDLIEQNKSLIEKRGKGAFGPLMGMIMKKVRGRVKAELVSGILKKRLEEFVA